jgi:7,8-dihydropterin-6-yl-methyl-4-(beta-D-ribofuranosyl)aminobenzene 5'-phosphate synthase
MYFKSDMKRYGAELIETKGTREILPGLFTTGELDGPVKEQAALVQTEAGTAVITGCAHPGIVRIVEIAKKNPSQRRHRTCHGRLSLAP